MPPHYEIRRVAFLHYFTRHAIVTAALRRVYAFASPYSSAFFRRRFFIIFDCRHAIRFSRLISMPIATFTAAIAIDSGCHFILFSISHYFHYLFPPLAYALAIDTMAASPAFASCRFAAEPPAFAAGFSPLSLLAD